MVLAANFEGQVIFVEAPVWIASLHSKLVKGSAWSTAREPARRTCALPVIP
jgi:hypothetical protein